MGSPTTPLIPSQDSGSSETSKSHKATRKGRWAVNTFQREETRAAFSCAESSRSAPCMLSPMLGWASQRSPVSDPGISLVHQDGLWQNGFLGLQSISYLERKEIFSHLPRESHTTLPPSFLPSFTFFLLLNIQGQCPLCVGGLPALDL